LRSTFVRPNERFAVALAALGAEVADVTRCAQDAEGGKAQVRRSFAAIQARERFVAEHGECEYNGASRVERSGPFRMTLRPCTRLSHADLHAMAVDAGPAG
jgi:hypothetical protein